jgi:hypothetical protein
MNCASSLSERLAGLKLRLKLRDRVRRRRLNWQIPVSAEAMGLEDRSMLSVLVPIPAGQLADHQVPLSKIIWNGGPRLSDGGIAGVESPSAAGAMKTITLTNNGPNTIYPFIRGENNGEDPNSTTKSKYYDPQDVHKHEFREYIGYQISSGGPAGKYLGLPSGATITFQVPLVLWDGDNMYIATDPQYLTSNNAVYNYSRDADISIAGTTPTGTTPKNTTTWVTSSSSYAAGESPIVMFYYTRAKNTVLRAAPAQLAEWTFRDPYLKQFINDPLQTFPLINYDVSYVNNLTGPVTIEASQVPITVGDRLSPTTPPTYYGYQDYGWNPTSLGTTAFDNPIKDFVNNTGAAAIGAYFGGLGWPEYYNPTTSDVVIPSGANVFLDSPLTDSRSPYASDNNYYLLASTTNGAGPIETSFGGALPDGTAKLYFAKPNGSPEQLAKLKVGMNVLDTGDSKVIKPGTKILKIMDQGSDAANPYLVLSKATNKGENRSGYALVYKNPVDDYAVTAITKLWYSWANYYVGLYKNFKEETASASYKPPEASKPQNEITLTSVPNAALAVGMAVKGSGIRPGTTILSITDSADNPIGSADAIGDKIYLSLLPSDTKARTQEYTFGKPLPIPHTTDKNTYALSFATDAEQEQARLFGGSVYAAMSAEAPVLQPSKLPAASALVGQVIQFYANLPTDGITPGGKNLTGQVRDVVKSILRGVWNFVAVPNQQQWYPNAATPAGGQNFNVYNLDPYVRFVHVDEGMNGYAFSVDDDVANPAAAGPILAPNNTANHLPDNLQIAFGGTKGFGNQNEWFPTIPWGQINTTATISKVGGTGDYQNDYMITLTGTLDPNAYLTLFNQINNPGPGQFGAFVSAAGYLAPGTTLTFKGPNGDNIPQIVLSQAPLQTTSTPIPVVISAGASPP